MTHFYVRLTGWMRLNHIWPPLVPAVDKTDQTLGVLHRNPSHKNIMVVSLGRCVSNNWDHTSPPSANSGDIVSASCSAEFRPF